MTRINNRTQEFIIKHRDILVCLFLVMATLAVYWQVQNYDFVNFDDSEYVYENRHVQEGLTLKSIIWAFTTIHLGNWHPLTWLSYMLDCQFYGMNPGWHHLTNLFFHIANTLLLFFVFRKMTGSLWRSGFVAGLFALHPLHVESVAWVSERKDVLSTFFWMMTMWSYIWYVEHPVFHRYILIILFFALGLMSKPMLVTLPFVLLLLDFYPLNRFQFQRSDGGASSQQMPIVLRLILEKTPLFVLVVMSSAITFYAQKHGGAVASLEVIPLKARVANALVSYANYIGKMVYPSKLAVLYPHPGMLPWWKIAGACLLLVSISFLAIRIVKQSPYFAVGWLWYLGTLVPVIGLVQVGSQAMADRYTYVPLIGIFIIIAWGIPELVEQWRYRKICLATLATVVFTILMAMTWKQVGYWKNSITLFEHTLKITSNNYLPHNNLGTALNNQGRTEEAIEHYLQALRIKPDYEKAHNNLGAALANQGRTEEAIEHYLQALRIKPDYVDAHYNLGLALANQGRTEEAIEHYLQALRIKPDYVDAHNNLAIALFRKGNIEGAIVHFRKALRINPDHIHAKRNLNKVLKMQQQKK
jgi:tetratricopeptide (TPR) repeat protein